MIFLSAGHHNKDAGAVANGFKESELTKELRDLIASEIKRIGGSVMLDNDNETLSEYIRRIKPGSGSVVCEVHFNASSSPNASGVECLHASGAGATSKNLSNEIASAVSNSLCITNRGAKSEAESARGRLAILRTNAGIACLPEICFITNKNDMESYQAKKSQVAVCIAHLLVRYDSMFS